MKSSFRFFALALACLLFWITVLPVSAESGSGSGVTTEERLSELAVGIINWKKSDVGAGEDGCLLNSAFLSLAGTTPGDWYPIGLGRFGVSDNNEGYLAVISENVQKRYSTEDLLDRAKATEWHRISLAILAMGGNPRRMGENGEIDLIADGTYNRVDAQKNGILGRQGINGFIWGLIALDSMYYEVPKGAYYTRDDMILNILSRQLSDGGWALSGNESDPDITGMAIQALAPYYNSEKQYAYTDRNSAGGGTVQKKVRTAVDEALECLSDLQQADGGYVSWGTANSESAVQVLVALTSLGIDPEADTRFIKNGKTVLDGILKYRNTDGGFIHSFTYQADNPTSLPDQSNTMASEQALYGIVSLYRYRRGLRRLYDFRPEQSDALKTQIVGTENEIGALTLTSPSEDIREAYRKYLEIPSGERSYVKNYKKLSELLAFAGIPYAEEAVDYNSGDAGVTTPMLEFTDADKAATDSLPAELTTEYRAEVLRLWNKIRNSFDFEGKDGYFIRLEKAKNQIERILDEVESLKKDLKEELYPFDSVGLADREKVYGLYDRYLALSEYDRQLLEPSDAEGLLKCKTQVDNLYFAVLISVILGVIAAALLLIVVMRIKKRRRKKALLKMPESDE